MARVFESVREQMVSLLATGEFISSKSQKEGKPRREAFRIVQELVGTHAREPNRPVQPPIISDCMDSTRKEDSFQPRCSGPAEHRPRVFIRSRL